MAKLMSDVSKWHCASNLSFTALEVTHLTILILSHQFVSCHHSGGRRNLNHHHSLTLVTSITVLQALARNSFFETTLHHHCGVRSRVSGIVEIVQECDPLSAAVLHE